MNNSIQDNLTQENDTGYTDEELNMLAEGEPAIDLEEIAESQYELSDDYMAEEKTSAIVPLSLPKETADAIRKSLHPHKKVATNEYGYL